MGVSSNGRSGGPGTPKRSGRPWFATVAAATVFDHDGAGQQVGQAPALPLHQDRNPNGSRDQVNRPHGRPSHQEQHRHGTHSRRPGRTPGPGGAMAGRNEKARPASPRRACPAFVPTGSGTSPRNKREPVRPARSPSAGCGTQRSPRVCGQQQQTIDQASPKPRPEVGQGAISKAGQPPDPGAVATMTHRHLVAQFAAAIGADQEVTVDWAPAPTARPVVRRQRDPRYASRAWMRWYSRINWVNANGSSRTSSIMPRESGNGSLVPSASQIPCSTFLVLARSA